MQIVTCRRFFGILSLATRESGDYNKRNELVASSPTFQNEREFWTDEIT